MILECQQQIKKTVYKAMKGHPFMTYAKVQKIQ